MLEVRSFLRDETNGLHRELDALVGEFAGAAEYTRFLRGTFRHRAPLERALAEAETGWRSQWRPRRLLPLLRQDFADLGIAEPATEPFVLSNDIASLLGAAYVMEGSALGARVLVRGTASLGFGEAFGARFLSAQAGSIDSWRDLLAELGRLDRQDWDRAARSAQSVFSHAIQAFTSEELSPA